MESSRTYRAGESVIVTRSRGRLITSQHEGVIVDGDTAVGFMLSGTDLATGHHVRSQFAPADELVPFGITQTIEPA